jgi:hypothetical protein
MLQVTKMILRGITFGSSLTKHWGSRKVSLQNDPDKLAELMAEQPGQVRARAFSIMKNLGFFAANVLLDKQVLS